MATYELYRQDFTLLKSFSGSDARQVVASSATVQIYRKGARINGTATLSGSFPQSVAVPVFDIGTIGANDTVVIGATSVTGTVTAVASTSVTVNWSAATSWDIGSRLIPVNRRPTAYSDTQGSGTPLGTSITTDSDGNGVFYTRNKDVDMVATVGATSKVIVDQSGLGGPPSLNPFDWGCEIDGTTDDLAPFNSMMSYAQIKGGQEIVLPAGTMLVSAALTPPSLITIKGKGRNISFIQGSTAGVPVLSTTTTTDFKLESITLKRSSAGTSGVPVVFLTGTRPTLRDVEIRDGAIGIADSSTDGVVDNLVFTGGSWESLITCTNATRTHYTSIRSRYTNNIGATTGAFVISDGCTGLRFTNCDVAPLDSSSSGNSGNGVYFKTSGGTQTRDVLFNGCRISGGLKTSTQRPGVLTDSGKIVQFIGCTVENSLAGYCINGGVSIKVIGGAVIGCWEESFDVNGGTHFQAIGVDSSDCNQSNNSKDHVNIAGTVTDSNIFKLTVGQHLLSSGISARYGVGLEDGAGARHMMVGVGGNTSELGSGFLGILKTNANRVSVSAGHNFNYSGNATFIHDTPGAGLGRTYTDGDTSPSVANSGYLNYASGSDKTITNFDDGSPGQVVVFRNAGATNITFLDGAGAAGFWNSTGATRVIAQSDVIIYQCVKESGGLVWLEIGYGNAP